MIREINPKDLAEDLGILGATAMGPPPGGSTLIKGPGQSPEVYIDKLGIEKP
jgi:hypothetical protein